MEESQIRNISGKSTTFKLENNICHINAQACDSFDDCRFDLGNLSPFLDCPDVSHSSESDLQYAIIAVFTKTSFN